MEHNKLTYAMIKTAVEKGIRDIQESPGRGIRNLVDLAANFATGSFQQLYLRIAQQELQNEQSVYYRLAERAVRETDRDLLTAFCLNLGYNSWTYGADFIRSWEERNGFNVPWCLTIHWSAELSRESQLIEAIIAQGQELGIFSYIIQLDAGFTDTDSLFALIAKARQCAFLLLMDPRDIDEALVERLLRARTALVALDLDSAPPQRLEEALQLLKQKRCFIAGYTRYDDLQQRLNDQHLLQQLRDPNIILLFLQPGSAYTPGRISEAEARMAAARQSLSEPVFPVDLYSDLALVDRNISSEACLVQIDSDGQVVVVNADEGTTSRSYNIRETALPEILAQSMPKKNRA